MNSISSLDSSSPMPRSSLLESRVKSHGLRSHSGGSATTASLSTEENRPCRPRSVSGDMSFTFDPRLTFVFIILLIHAPIVALEKWSVDRMSQLPKVGKRYTSSDRMRCFLYSSPAVRFLTDSSAQRSKR